MKAGRVLRVVVAALTTADELTLIEAELDALALIEAELDGLALLEAELELAFLAGTGAGAGAGAIPRSPGSAIANDVKRRLASIHRRAMIG